MAENESKDDINKYELIGQQVGAELLQNANIPTRQSYDAGEQFEGKRRIDEVLGYPRDPGVDLFREYYQERGIASVIVDRPAHDTWKEPPELKDGSGGESDFMQEWQSLVKRHKVFHFLERLDKLSGIGRFGALFFGWDDTGDISKEVNNPGELLYIRPYSEDRVEIKDIQGDQSKEQFGYPTEYKFDFTIEEEDLNIDNLDKEDVHASRVLHVAEGLLDNELFGEPRLKKIINRLFDLDKLIGAGPESFWQQAAKGYHVQEKEGANLGQQDWQEISEEFGSFMNGFKRVLTSSGVNVDELTGEVNVDPSNPYDIVISTISVKTGIPKRLLQGSESAELASSQDRKNWFDRVGDRRVNFAEPQILRPFVDTCIQYDVIAAPDGGSYEVEWPTLWKPNRKELAEIMYKKAQALNEASGGMPQDLMDPKNIVDFVFDMEPGEAKERWAEGETGDGEEPMDETSEEVQNQMDVMRQLTEAKN